MFDWLTGRSQSGAKARDLYGAVVAQARDPGFYLAFGAPDTPEGRFELVALHLSLLVERLGAPDLADEELRRATVEAFVADMDDNMREWGIGDPSVRRRVRRAAAGLQDRVLAYRAALAEPGDAALCAILGRTVYAGLTEADRAGHPAALARQVRAEVASLAAQAPQALRAGRVIFTRPDLTKPETSR